MSDDGGGMGFVPKIIIAVLIMALIVVGVVLGLYYAAASKTCTTSDDCLKVLGNDKCFVEAGATTGHCMQCGTNADCPVDSPYCVAGKCATALVDNGGKCTTDAQCPTYAGKTKCFVANGTCGECAVDGDCPTSAPYCVGGKCVASNCTTTADCAGNAAKPYCVNGGCAGACSTDAQCATSGQKCVGGSCKTPCTAATASTACGGAAPYCGTDGYCTTTNCASDADCKDTLKPSCDTTTKTCSAKTCTTSYDCGNVFDATGLGLRCASGSCRQCDANTPCGANFSCVNARCVFDPLNAATGKKWNFYRGATNLYRLARRTDPSFVQNARYYIDELLVKAEAGGIDIILVYNYDPASNQANAQFYSYANNYFLMPPSAPYEYTSSSTLKSANGVFVSNIHGNQKPSATPLPWAVFANRAGVAANFKAVTAPVGTPPAANAGVDALKAYAVANKYDAFKLVGTTSVTWYTVTGVSWSTAVESGSTLYVNTSVAAPGGNMAGVTRYE